MKLYFRLSLSCLFFSLASIQAQAWTLLQMTSKEAQITSEKGQKIPLKLGATLNEGDIIETQNSKLKLVESGSILVIAENTSLRLTPPINKDAKSLPAIDLLKGKVRAQISKDIAPKYIYKIPSAVAGIRGTEFFMSASTAKEVICVLEGLVEANELIGEKRTAPLAQNKGWIREGEKAPVIVDVNAEDRAGWIKATTITSDK